MHGGRHAGHADPDQAGGGGGGPVERHHPDRLPDPERHRRRGEAPRQGVLLGNHRHANRPAMVGIQSATPPVQRAGAVQGAVTLLNEIRAAVVAKGVMKGGCSVAALQPE